MHGPSQTRIIYGLAIVFCLPTVVPVWGQANASGSPSSQSIPAAPEPPKPVATPQTAPAPAGTAAAPDEGSVGAAASRPAGAVVAPAKQRRALSLVLKVGLILGGAAAVGTVIALSKSNSARP